MRVDRRRYALAALVCAVLGTVLAGIVAVAGGDEPLSRSLQVPVTTPPDCTLRDQDGQPTSLREQRGRVVALTFLFASCRDTCPLQAARVGEAVRRAGGGTRAMAISVDPVGDTPERVGALLGRFGLERRLRYLTGSRAELAPVWARYGIVPIGAADRTAAASAARLQPDQQATGPVGPYGAGTYGYGPAEGVEPGAPWPSAPRSRPLGRTDPQRYRYEGRARHGSLAFEHSAYVLLIDRQGRQRSGVRFEQLETDALARDLRRLAAER